jgi:hypothetical protein
MEDYSNPNNWTKDTQFWFQSAVRGAGTCRTALLRRIPRSLLHTTATTYESTSRSSELARIRRHLRTFHRVLITHFAQDDGTRTKMIAPQYAFGGGGAAEGQWYSVTMNLLLSTEDDTLSALRQVGLANTSL